MSDPHTGTVVLTAAAGTALILPLALLGRRLAGPRAGAITAWVAAIAPGLSTTLVNRGAGSEAVYTLLVISAVWLVVSGAGRDGWPRMIRFGGAGGLVGLAYLTRPEGLLMAVPLGLAVIVVALRSPTGPRSTRRSAAAGLVGVAVFGLPIAACIVPYAAYLHDHTGQWQLTAKTQDASIEAWHAVAAGDRETRDSIIYALDDTGLELGSGRFVAACAGPRDDPSGYAEIVSTNVGQLARAVAIPEQQGFLAWLLLPLPVVVIAGVRGLAATTVGADPAPARRGRAAGRHGAGLLRAAPVSRGHGRGGHRLRRRGPGRSTLALAAGPDRSDHGAARPVHGPGVPGSGGMVASVGPHRSAPHRRMARRPTPQPTDRIMTRSMVVEFYADRPTVAIPYADLDQIVAFARHYGARYLVVDWYTVVRLRPQLEPLRTADAGHGLRLVHELEAEGRLTRSSPSIRPRRARPAVGPSLVFVGDGA